MSRKRSESAAGHLTPSANAAKQRLPAALSDTVGMLRGLQRRRVRFIRAVNRLDLAAMAAARLGMGWRYDLAERERNAVARRARALVAAIYECKLPAEAADVVGAVYLDVELFRKAREPMVKARADVEREMRRAARSLPSWSGFAKGVDGFGELALAVLVGEAGDLAGYPDVDRLWKRFGLAPFEGKAASTWMRHGGLDADEWQAVGYRGRRNAETFAVLADPLFRRQSVVNGPYRAVYDREKARFLAAGKNKGHAHMHGLRCMRKAAIEDLWRAWTGRPPKQRSGGGQARCIGDADLSMFTPAGAQDAEAA